MTSTKQSKQAATHTPGPWRIADGNAGWDILSGGFRIAWVAANRANGRKYPKGADNAQLIAVAPEMLAELIANEQLLTEYVEWHHKHQNGCSVEWENRLKATRDVIAKATA
jgi:hypothetical protein